MSETLMRRFCVHGEAARAQLVEGLSFEDAALSFVEHEHPASDDAGDVTLYVEDLATGERQCLCVDLDAGTAAPCD